MTDAHEEKETLSVDVDIPQHDDRVTTGLFLKTKRFLIKVGSLVTCFSLKRKPAVCWVCGKTEKELGAPLEAHHFGIERAYIGAKIKWDLVAEDFPLFDWKNFNENNPVQFVDDMSVQGLLLCKEHHTGKDTGIHTLPFSLWVMQRYLVDGTRFNPNEVIDHGPGI